MRKILVFALAMAAMTALGQVRDRLGVQDIRQGGEWTRTFSDGSTLDLSGNTPVNVKGYPFLATGDGSTDDTGAIQAAIDSVESWGGGGVYLPAGIYSIQSGPLTINLDDGECEQISIIGDGKHESRLILTAAGTENLLEIDGWRLAARSFKLQDIGMSLGTGTGANAVDVLNASRGLIDECYIYGFAAGAGVKFDAEDDKNSDLNKVSHTYIGACQDGIWNDLSATSNSYCDAHIITGCTLVNNSRYDIHLSSSGGLVGKADAVFVGDTWIQAGATGTHGIYLDDDVGAVKVSNTNIDGEAATQAITIGADCGYSLWSNVAVDGGYTDNSGLAEFSNIHFSAPADSATSNLFKSAQFRANAAEPDTVGKRGLLWFDGENSTLKFYDGSGWQAVH